MYSNPDPQQVVRYSVSPDRVPDYTRHTDWALVQQICLCCGYSAGPFAGTGDYCC